MQIQIADVLKKILEKKSAAVNMRRIKTGMPSIISQAKDSPDCRGFIAALQAKMQAKQAAVIAEIKKASPSKGLLRANYQPAEIARSYQTGGASCLSVLTETDFFQGDDAHLLAAKSACSLPILRKDFIVDEYQIYESKVLGADCVLLIVAALSDQQLNEYYQLAVSMGLDVLVEVHDQLELARALSISPKLLGINNRNLRTFETDLQTTLRLRQQVSNDVLLVTESGILNQADVALMRAAKVQAFLVGEAFMRADDPGIALRQLFA